MTTGITTSGIDAYLSTQSGAGRLRIGYYKKTWSGGDSTPLSAPTLQEPGNPRPTHTVVHTPKGPRVVKLRDPFRNMKFRRKESREDRYRDNAYSCDIIIESDREITYQNSPGGWWYTGTGVNTGFGDFYFSGLDWSANDDIALIGRLRNQIAGSEFNLAVTSAESKMALGMIAQSAHRIFGAYKAVRRGDMRSAARLLSNDNDRTKLTRKSAANNWLELQYGWLPLLNDVYNGAQYLAEYGLKRRVRRYKVRLSKGGTVTPTTPYGVPTGTGKLYAQLIANVEEVNEASLIGLTDPLSVAWELLPYSFVADWFIPVGNYLSARALSSSITGTFVKTVTTKTDGRCEKLRDGWPKASNLYHSRKNITVRRTVSSNLLVPRPELKQLSELESWRKTVNAVALLTQLKFK